MYIRMTHKFDSKETEVPTYHDGKHPLELFIQGDTKMRGRLYLIIQMW